MSKKNKRKLSVKFALLGAVLVLIAFVIWKIFPSVPQVNEIDQELSRLSAMDLFDGAVLVARGEDILLEAGYGMANKETAIPFTSETVSSIGSITKQFTAAAILKLEEQGKLSVSDSLGKYFPNLPIDKSRITIHHLLTHTSGLIPAIGKDEDWVSKDELLTLAWASDLLALPGIEYNYSNVGYSVLAAIIENESGKKYENYLFETFFEKQEMLNTGYWIPDWDMQKVANGYRGDFDYGTTLDKQTAELGPSWYLVGNGGILSTVKDMYKWFRALRNERVLNKFSLTKLFDKHIDEGEGESFYGYGWVTFNLKDKIEMIGHNGGNGYFFADLNFFPNRDDLFYVLLVNDEQKSEALSQHIVRRLLGNSLSMGLLPLPPKIIPINKADLKEIKGKYILPSGENISLVKSGPALKLTPLSLNAHAELFASSKDKVSTLLNMSKTTQNICKGLVNKNFFPLFEAYNKQHALSALEQSYKEKIKRWEDDLGQIKGFKVFGTESRKDGGYNTFYELKFSRGSKAFYYIWRDNILQGYSRRNRPRQILFYPTGDGVFDSFDPDDESALRLNLIVKSKVDNTLKFKRQKKTIVLTGINEN